MSAAFGLLGTGFGAWLQGEANLNLEKQKFEANLILKMIETNGNQEQSASNLSFFIKAGLLENSTLESRLSDLIKNKEVPSIGVVSGMLKESDPDFDFTKSLQEQLSKLGYYKGEINSIESEELRTAVLNFQKDKGLAAVGVVTFRTRSLIEEEYSKTEK